MNKYQKSKQNKIFYCHVFCLSIILLLNTACSENKTERKDTTTANQSNATAIIDHKTEQTHSQPNILLIVADDLGYSDVASYGGEIDTPNIDSLAASGISFSNFHTGPVCAVTRAMLLSGNDNHIAGMGSQDLEAKAFGYEGHLTDRIVPIPALLQQAGYHTSITGKWHLGIAHAHLPAQKGFMDSFIIPEGVANHYSEKGWLERDPITDYLENNLPVRWQEGDYSTDFYTTKLIEYIENNRSSGRPFFAFAAYTSPHWPLQVDEKYWHKYRGKYKDGYEVLRKERFAKLKELGYLPNNAALPKLHESVKPWESLHEQEKQIEQRKMELYAGMVDNLDTNIGRIIRYLKRSGQFENTLIVFMSDNGAAANDFFYHPYFAPYLTQHYNDTFGEMGEKDSFISYGPQWAEASSAPFRYFKGYTTQGGLVSPLIISGPHVNHSGTINHAFTTVLDIAPTFYDYAQIDYPKQFEKVPVYPLKGASLKQLLANNSDKIHDENYVFVFEHRQNIVVRKGQWKLVNEKKPFDLNNFALYKVSDDVSEQHDLKKEYPDVYQSLIAQWLAYQKQSQVQIPTPNGISR